MNRWLIMMGLGMSIMHAPDDPPSGGNEEWEKKEKEYQEKIAAFEAKEKERAEAEAKRKSEAEQKAKEAAELEAQKKLKEEEEKRKKEGTEPKYLTVEEARKEAELIWEKKKKEEAELRAKTEKESLLKSLTDAQKDYFKKIHIQNIEALPSVAIKNILDGMKTKKVPFNDGKRGGVLEGFDSDEEIMKAADKAAGIPEK